MEHMIILYSCKYENGRPTTDHPAHFILTEITKRVSFFPWLKFKGSFWGSSKYTFNNMFLTQQKKITQKNLKKKFRYKYLRILELEGSSEPSFPAVSSSRWENWSPERWPSGPPATKLRARPEPGLRSSGSWRSFISTYFNSFSQWITSLYQRSWLPTEGCCFECTRMRCLLS